MKKYATTKTGNGTAAACSAYATIIKSEAVEGVSYTLPILPGRSYQAQQPNESDCTSAKLYDVSYEDMFTHQAISKTVGQV